MPPTLTSLPLPLRLALFWLGLPGWIGLGLLAASLVFALTANLPARRQLQSLHLTQLVEPHDLRTVTPAADPLHSFYQFFPSISVVPHALQRLKHHADEQGLSLSHGEYRWIKSPAPDQLVSYEMTLPVSGDYLSIRRFLAHLLQDLPYATLDSISFQKSKAGDATLSAQVKLSLYLLES